MASTTSTLIYIGNIADLDPEETNFSNENAAAVFGTYTRADMAEVTVTQTDDDENGAIENDDSGQVPDTFAYDLGSGPVVSGLDNEGRYSGSYIDGTGASNPVALSVYQLQNGDTFIRLPDGISVSKCHDQRADR